MSSLAPLLTFVSSDRFSKPLKNIFFTEMTWAEIKKYPPDFCSAHAIIPTADGLIGSIVVLDQDNVVHKFCLLMDPRKKNDLYDEYLTLLGCCNLPFSSNIVDYENYHLEICVSRNDASLNFKLEIPCLRQEYLGDVDFLPNPYQLVDLISVMRGAGFYHGDLKKENLRLVNGHLRVFDFDQARAIPEWLRFKCNVGFVIWIFWVELCAFKRIPFLRFYGFRSLLKILGLLIFAKSS